MLVVVLAALGCAGPPVTRGPLTPSPSPSTAAPGGPAASALPTEWVRQPASPSLAGAEIHDVVPVDGGFIAVGCAIAQLMCTGPAAWRSADGVVWAPRMDLPTAEGESGGTAVAAAVGSGGTVIGGVVRRGDRSHAALWHATPDGAPRQAGGDAFEDAGVSAVEALGSGFVAVGSGAFMEAAGFRAWRSVDGLTWLDATPRGDGEAFATGLLGDGDRLVAWGPTCGVCVAETAWWSSATGAEWQTEAEAPGLDGISLRAIVPIDDGHIAAGSMQDAEGELAHGMWQRAGGQDSWSRVPEPALPPEASISHLLPIGAGLVAAGTAVARDGSRALVVARRPGSEAWTELAALDDLWVLDLLQHPRDPRRIIVIGHVGIEASGPLVTWVGSVDWAP